MAADNKHLTEMHAPELALMIESTKRGQAHWADPSRNVTCRECIHWRPAKRKVWDDAKLAWIMRDLLPYDSKGKLRTRLCGKFREFSGRNGRRLAHTAWACRYFVESPMPPAPEIEPTEENMHLWHQHDPMRPRREQGPRQSEIF